MTRMQGGGGLGLEGFFVCVSNLHYSDTKTAACQTYHCGEADRRRAVVWRALWDGPWGSVRSPDQTRLAGSRHALAMCLNRLIVLSERPCGLESATLVERRWSSSQHDLNWHPWPAYIILPSHARHVPCPESHPPARMNQSDGYAVGVGGLPRKSEQDVERRPRGMRGDVKCASGHHHTHLFRQ